MPWKDPAKRRAAHARYRAADPERFRQHGRKGSARYRERHKEKTATANRAYLLSIRLQAIDVYSHGTFACRHCGYDTVEALCIDHLNDDGKFHRTLTGAGPSFWLWLKRNTYPDGFQVLCHNCNFLKELRRRRRKSEEQMLASLTTVKMP